MGEGPHNPDPGRRRLNRWLPNGGVPTNSCGRLEVPLRQRARDFESVHDERVRAGGDVDEQRAGLVGLALRRDSEPGGRVDEIVVDERLLEARQHGAATESGPSIESLPQGQPGRGPERRTHGWHARAASLVSLRRMA